MMTKYNAKAHCDAVVGDDYVEYIFTGRGTSTPTTWHEPGDSEMEITACVKYTFREGCEVQIERDYNVDTAIMEVAASGTKTIERVEDLLIEQLWNDAEPDEPDYPDDGEDF